MVGKSPVGKSPVGKSPVGKSPVGKFPVGKSPRTPTHTCVSLSTTALRMKPFQFYRESSFVFANTTVFFLYYANMSMYPLTLDRLLAVCPNLKYPKSSFI